MRHIFVLGAALLLSFQAHAAKVIWVYVQGSDITFIYGLNDKNIVAGTYYVRDRTVHGFFGAPGSTSYDTFQFKGASTHASAIDNKGNIVGISHFFDGETDCEQLPYERTPDGKIAQLKRGRKALTGDVGGMALLSGKFVGSYCDAGGNAVPFQGRSSKWQQDLDISIPGAQPRGINASGTVVGHFKTQKLHGFILKDGVASVVDFPGARNTQLTSINDAGIAVGYYHNSFHDRPFMLDTNTNTFTEIAFNRHRYGSAFAQAINNKGYIAINVGIGRGYVLCPEGADCPGGEAADIAMRKFAVGRFPAYRPR